MHSTNAPETTTYAGFAIDPASARIAHLSVGDGPEAWGSAAGTGVLSYFFWHRLHVAPGECVTKHASFMTL
jgi:hypothetical protein